MGFHVVIPARFGSTRLPGKALVDIHGKPMVQWMVHAAIRSAAHEVIVATDDERVARAVFDPRRPNERIAVMTRNDHESGTDRVAEVARLRKWSESAIVVNVQGDEPHLPPALIEQVAMLLAQDPRADIATLSAPIQKLEEFLDPNAVKVVCAKDGSALYFSRAPIPWNRDSASTLANQREFPEARRHIGLYAYRVAALLKLTQLAPTTLERIEKLEQLRALHAGMRIIVADATEPPGMGVDTEADLARVRAAPPPN